MYLQSIDVLRCFAFHMHHCNSLVIMLQCSGSETAGGSNCRSHDLSSDVTLQSCDTWGGLAPPTRMHPIPSDTVSVESARLWDIVGDYIQCHLG